MTFRSDENETSTVFTAKVAEALREAAMRHYDDRVDEAVAAGAAVKFRPGRIWRLGEKELRVAKYFRPPPTELHDALEDREPTPEAVSRYERGLVARQLTSSMWHAFWNIAR